MDSINDYNSDTIDNNIINYNYINNPLQNYENVYNTDAEKECLLKSIFQYLRHPAYPVHQRDMKMISKLWDVFRIISLSIIISLILSILATIALNYVGYNPDQNVFSDPIWRNPIYIIGIGIILGPILEELTFRMGLKFSPFRFSVSLVLLLLVILPIMISISGITISSSAYLFIYGAIIILIGLILGILLKKFIDTKPIKQFYTRNFRFIFYLLVIIFAAGHLTNYRNLVQIWFLAPLIVSSQFVGGLMLSYVRMKYGLRWSIFQHMIYNLIVFTPAIMAGFITIKDVNNITETEATTIMIIALIGLTIAAIILISSIQPIWEYFSQKQSLKLKMSH